MSVTGISREEVLEEIQKAAITTGTSAAAMLTPEQSHEFIMAIQDRNPLARRIRVEPRDRASGSIEKIGVATGVIRASSENADDGYRAEPTFATVPYQAKGIRLPWEITLQFLRYNVEGETVEDKIWNLMTGAFGRDLIRLGVLGDTASGDPSLSIDDGWLKQIGASGLTNRVNLGNTTFGSTWPNKDHLFAIEAALPDKYKQVDDDQGGDNNPIRGLRPVWLSSPATKMQFVEYRTDRNTAAGDAALGGNDANTDKPLGYEWLAVPQFPNNRIVLTPPQNLVQVPTTQIERYKVGPETDWELATRRKKGYVFFLDVDHIVEEMDAVADGYNVGVAV